MYRTIASILFGMVLVVGLSAPALAESGAADEGVVVIESAAGASGSETELPEDDLDDDNMLPEIPDDTPVIGGRFFIDASPSDTTNHGAEVNWMGTSGISTGWAVKGGRVFRGMDNVRRCDFAAFMYRLADLRDDGKVNGSVKLSKSVKSLLAGVSDCNEDTSHAKEIAWMIDTGISKGWEDKGGKTVSFHPMADVARQDMAAFLYRFADWNDDKKLNGSPKKGTKKITFSDVKSGDSNNHASEVQWLASVGVSTGWKSGNKYQFRGKQAVRRQDMAAFLSRLNSYLG